MRRTHNQRLVIEINKRGFFRSNFLTNRVVSTWNELSENIVSAKSVNGFKSKIDSDFFGLDKSK